MAVTVTATITTLLSLLTLSLLAPLTTQISPQSIKNAAEILSNSGYNSISLTLSLISPTLIATLPSATLFAPLDDSFSNSLSSGQPSYSQLQFHFCPQFYSFNDLQSRSFGSRITTLNPNYSLTVTSFTSNETFINGVRVMESPVFDDGNFVVYGTDRFFNPNFTLPTETENPTGPGNPTGSGPKPETPTENKPGIPTPDPVPGSDPSPSSTHPKCGELTQGNDTRSLLLEASKVLRFKGYSIMAGFLDLQLMQFGVGNDKKVLTVFAPRDVIMQGYMGNFTDLSSVFLRHVVGCGLSWGDLTGLNDGFVVSSLLKGFYINITRNTFPNGRSFSLLLNREAYVDLPELYRNERIVVHGLSGVLVDSATTEKGFEEYQPPYPTYPTVNNNPKGKYGEEF